LKYVLNFAVLAALHPAVAQTPDIQVTYTTAAVPVKRAVEEIAKATGAKIDVAAEAASETVVICVKDTPLFELMKRLADVVSGEWRTDKDGTQWLSYSPEKLKQEAAAEIAARQKEVAKAIKSMARGPDREELARENPNYDVDLLDLEAGTKVVFQILDRVSVADLASVGSGERLVFSSSPTRMQRPLGDVREILSSFTKEHNKEAREYLKQRKIDEDKHPQTVEEKQRLREFEILNGYGPGGSNFLKIFDTPAKLLFIVGNGGEVAETGNLDIEVRMYDPEGKIMLSTGLWLPVSDSVWTEPASTGATKRTQISFSPSTQELGRVFNFSDPTNIPAPSQELREKLLRPDLYDPYSFGQSEALIELAKAKGENVVCNYPDTLYPRLDREQAQRYVTVENLADFLRSTRVLDVEEADGWFIVRPLRPSHDRGIKVDRRALANLMAAAERDGIPSLEDVAAYAAKCPDPRETPWVTRYTALFAKAAFVNGLNGAENWDMLRLYGKLPQSQRQSLRSGAGLSVGSLSPELKALMAKFAFGYPVRLNVARPTDTPVGPYMAFLLRRRPTIPVDYRDEPTEVMSDGLPGNATISLRTAEENFVMPVRKGPDVTHGKLASLDADALAMLQYVKERPAVRQDIGMIRDIGDVKLGNRRVLDFTFTFARGVTHSETLVDDTLPSNAPILTLATLPDSFKAMIQARLAALRKENLYRAQGVPERPPPQ
jgi:hypothetical protein